MLAVTGQLDQTKRGEHPLAFINGHGIIYALFKDQEDATLFGQAKGIPPIHSGPGADGPYQVASNAANIGFPMGDYHEVNDPDNWQNVGDRWRERKERDRGALDAQDRGGPEAHSTPGWDDPFDPRQPGV